MQAKHRSFQPILSSSRTHTQMKLPVLTDIASKLKAWTLSASFYSCRRLWTAMDPLYPAPEANLGTLRSLSTPSPEISTGTWSTFHAPKFSGMIFPSQCSTSGHSGTNNSDLTASACSILAFLCTMWKWQGRRIITKRCSIWHQHLNASRSKVLFYPMH